MTARAHDGEGDSGCDSCALGRRAFMLGAARSVAALAGIAALPTFVRALPSDSGARSRDERHYPIPASNGVSIDEESSVILARTGGKVYAFSLACPHKQTALRWQERNARFECPKHKSRYQPDGVFISGRATRGMDRYAIRREGDALVVDLGRLFREDRDAAAWRTAVVEL